MKHSSPKTDGIIDRSQRDWYKDAIIYQLHIKAFQDANNDGIGDFAGLMQRLDYIQELGVNTIWLLPFYPSPLRDDGYDIADYRAINPSYGQMKDFRAFVAEAHRRGLRVITELVINHTSDQHPWFQRARTAKPGSPARDFYVWSDTDAKFPETRIIFLDTEKSNWTWDPVAGQYYWHRFYSHQPDLNFDNPRVLQEVLKVMHFWLEMGVDGLRLDAIPYLIEREGTNNENLPETHDVLKKIRAELDAHYEDRMLLAEANQWPEDTRPYFGEGDECHMGFHFPLMPRMYMALAQEDRHPISDIMRQTPEIPDECQWGIFLRNHDELTLEMVTDRERDYLWQTYADDKRARINLGIRRRLAPLMQNDRRKIELMNSMLMSMPGTPILYYGDELGMGDNYYLGDRDGVRTPMQWSPDLNAGFSRANPQQLYLPVILDPIYGYQAINVERQASDPSSLLNWMRKLIGVRKQHPAFGRGTFRMLYPRNRKILAYIRQHEDDVILCVANLSRAAQAVELDLHDWKGMVPLEVTGRSPFPPIGDLPYLVTLPAHGFYWFHLTNETEAPHWHQQVPDILPEFITLTTRDGSIRNALEGREGRQFEAETLPRFLELQRWFGAKDKAIQSAKLKTLSELPDTKFVLAVSTVNLGDQEQKYFLPLSSRWGEEHIAFGAPTLSYTLAKLRRGSRVGALIDGAYDPDLSLALLDGLRQGLELEGPAGRVVFRPNAPAEAFADVDSPHPTGIEQSNVSIICGDSVILKIYRRLRPGPQPEVEMARFLTNETDFKGMPAFMGSIDHETQDGECTVLATAFSFVRNQGDAWYALTSALQRHLQDWEALRTSATPETEQEPAFPRELEVGERLGRRTAELHAALATPTEDADFAMEPTAQADVLLWTEAARTDVVEMFDALERASADSLTEGAAELRNELLAKRDSTLERLQRGLTLTPSGGRTRIHGDYHLGQVLVEHDEFIIIDFEGEPGRTIEERRAKMSPLRDVAGMLRSIDYLARSILRETVQGLPPESARAAQERLQLWRDTTVAQFLEGYRSEIEGSSVHPEDREFETALLDLFLIQKAAYEIMYELSNRPAWAELPMSGLLELLGGEDA